MGVMNPYTELDNFSFQEKDSKDRGKVTLQSSPLAGLYGKVKIPMRHYTRIL